ncbi:MAG TPA: secondary thiamine-phosphate synthase enzyme YjbQ [Candidatus Desulfaltia sp.]|nr:secondary thiamine-phosphate synthase enzyme YjbQ [Candidatus Desulfaltia sp.]
MKKFDVQTPTREAFVDITRPVEDEVRKSKVQSGICVVYVPHTTAAVTINENADPTVRQDLLMALRKAIPDSLPYAHSEGNSPAHVKSSLVGASIAIPIEDGKLVLGTWQGIFFCEFDGPRRRQVYIKIIPS